MMKKKMKKVVCYLMSTVMFFSFFLVTPQGVRAEETQDPTEFSGAKLIGNGTWTDPDTHKTYNVYYNDEPYFQAASDKAPARSPAYIELNQAYKTRMDNAVGALGGIYDPGDAYYYFTLDAPAKVTIYGQCSTADNSFLAIQKMDSVDKTFQPSTISLGMVKGTDAVKSMSASLTAGSYLVSLNWGQGRATEAGACYSYIKVNADYNINREIDSVWNETFPNGYNSKTEEYMCTPYKIGKVMNGVTAIGTNESTSHYYAGYYSFTLSEKTQFHLSELVNVDGAYVFPKDGDSSSSKRLVDNAVILEPDDYILVISAGSESETYSFNSYTSAVPAIAGVDTLAEKGWSVSGETVTINNLDLNSIVSEDYAEFCIWSGDKENAGYGKGTARLVIKGNCFIKKLVIDCPVEVLCEEGAQLFVGKLVVNTDGEADGKLTYVGGTTYNAATKIFEVPCTHKEMSIAGEKAATCTEPGYTGDQTCDACGKVILGQKTEPLGHKWDNGNVTKEPTVLAEGVKTFTCTNPGCKEIKTEAIAKLPEPNNNSNTSAVPAVAGVDTIAEKGWSVSGETVTINNLNVNSGDYAEFCIWSGDKENAGYGKGTARLVIKGNCFIKTLVIDCPVEVLCEEGAQLLVGELVVNTDDEADGKLTYVGGTTYNAATNIFELCTHKEMSIVGKKAATCTEPGYTGDQTCDACGKVILGQKTEPLGHKWDNGKVTKEPTVLAKGVKTFTCTNPGCKEIKTEAIAKLPEPKKNEVIEDKTGNDYKVADPTKKEVTYKAPTDKKAKTVTIPDKVEIDGVTYKVTKVDDGAFKGNKTVTTVKVPSSVTTIGKDAFNGCSKLKTVSVPKNVTEIGKNAFKGCAALTKITLPNKCTKIGANAFNGCKKMKTITIKSTKLTSKSISSGAFKGLSKSVTIKVPKKQLKAYKKLLEKKGFKGKVKA